MSEFTKCIRCGFQNDGVCTCPPYDKWYACPIESNKPENIQALKEYAEYECRAESEDENVKKADGCYYDFGKAIVNGTPLPEDDDLDILLEDLWNDTESEE